MSILYAFRCVSILQSFLSVYVKLLKFPSLLSEKKTVEHPLNLWEARMPASPSEGLSCKFRFVLTGAEVSGLLFTTPLPNPMVSASAFAFLSSPGGIAPDKKHQQKTNRFIHERRRRTLPKKPASNTQVVFFQVTSKKGWHLPGSV